MERKETQAKEVKESLVVGHIGHTDNHYKTGTSEITDFQADDHDREGRQMNNQMRNSNREQKAMRRNPVESLGFKMKIVAF